jgi:ATP-dependent RNA helicase TDRD9
MAFTTEEILSFFSVRGANPLASRVPENVDILPTPGHGLYSRGREAAERRRDDVFGSRNDDLLSDLPSPGFGDPVYNVLKGEDIDVSEDYFQPLSHGDDDACAGGTGVKSLYERFSFATNENPHLPVTERREDVIRTIESNQVTIIQGATGSGKSTLVPQFLLEHYATHQRHCNIVCTQPRRIATRSIARYVAKCRGWQLGTLVGYQVYNDKVTSEDTRLTFVTTGVLLEKLVSMKNMNEYTHIILDEVHERNIDTDLCLLLVRKLLRTNSRQVKVVLMSATLESQEYAQYFAVRLPHQPSPIPAPVLSVEGRVWPVMEFYLDDLRPFGEVEGLMPENPRVSRTQLQMCKTLIEHFDHLEEEDPDYGRGDFFRGTVLCFLPGMPDIKEMDRLLDHEKFATRNRINILPLHSEISADEQYKVFLAPNEGMRKVSSVLKT